MTTKVSRLRTGGGTHRAPEGPLGFVPACIPFAISRKVSAAWMRHLGSRPAGMPLPLAAYSAVWIWANDRARRTRRGLHTYYTTPRHPEAVNRGWNHAIQNLRLTPRSGVAPAMTTKVRRLRSDGGTHRTPKGPHRFITASSPKGISCRGSAARMSYLGSPPGAGMPLPVAAHSAVWIWANDRARRAG